MATEFTIAKASIRVNKEAGHKDEVFVNFGDTRLSAFYVDEGTAPDSGFYDITFKAVKAPAPEKPAEQAGTGTGI